MSDLDTAAGPAGGSTAARQPWVPPPYPYDRLDSLRAEAARHEGGAVDLSIGTPTDPPPPAVLEAMAHSGTERGYPQSVGSPAFRAAAAGWLRRRLGVEIATEAVAACIGTKELVAGLPQWLHLRRPDRDTVLYPAISYPTYAMGAALAGLRAVPVAPDATFGLDLSSIDEEDAARALCLWVNSPGNPAGGLDDLGAAAAWGRARGIPVLSDECYVEFTWDGPSRTILEHGTDGLLAVHSLSKRSNLAGARVGFYAGDTDLVHFLSETRKHAGFMVPGPVQAGAVAAWADDGHVDEQRRRYRRRLARMADLLGGWGIDVPLPSGAFYLWVPTGGDEWELADRLAREAGVVSSPGEFYGPAGRGYLRLAMVQPDAQLDLVARRLGVD
jgi:succinyldiaminopimelate transaminase